VKLSLAQAACAWQDVGVKNITVSSLGNAIGSIRFSGDRPVYTPSKKAIASGMIAGPGMIQDFKAAAVYLTKESAAVSCTCNGYVVSK